jgi:hypothetical protein
MRRAGRFAGFFIFVALPAPSFAQMPVPTGWDEAALTNFRGTTRCLANGLPDVAATFVTADPESDAFDRADRRLARGAPFCVLRRIRLASDMLRVGLAEALYLHRFPAPPTLTALETPVPAELELDAIAACIASRQPAGVDRLLRTAWKSAGEDDAMHALQGEIHACAGPVAFPPLITMIRFRMALAAALYRRAIR